MNLTDDAKIFFDELLSPIPFFVRPMAKKMILQKINEIHSDKSVLVPRETLIEAYIAAGARSAKDSQRIRTFLNKKGVDITPYQHLFVES